MSNKRLEQLLLNRGGQLQDKDLLDCYNQTFARELACTITTGIDFRNYHYVYEFKKIADMSIQELQKKAKKTTKGLGLRAGKPSDKSLANKPKGKGWQFVITEDGRLAWVRLRKLTCREVLRLMDVDEANIDKLLTAGISDSQIYKMAGNSIVIACMEGIFRNLFSTEEQEPEGQLTLF